MKYRRFGKEDYRTFSGAEPFDDGSEPFYIEGKNYIAVLDLNGIGVFPIVNEELTDYSWILEAENSNPKVSEIVANGFPETVNGIWLKFWGFEMI